ncbi:MAG TPA: cell division protein FtsL [Syntrophales bacterium]|nr:cell division protein FtsL [Syntrophales bacterium]
MSTAELTLQNVRGGESLVFGLKHVPFIIVICSVMMLSLVYVWPHIHMTELEYQVAEQMNIRQKLLEERGKLKIEYATLKSPQRIETIARGKLQMTYPERGQVVYLK